MKLDQCIPPESIPNGSKIFNVRKWNHKGARQYGIINSFILLEGVNSWWLSSSISYQGLNS